MLRAALLAAVASALLAAPASALRWAAPDGSGTDCTETAPCALDTALEGSSESVRAAPGEYGPYSGLLFAADLFGVDPADPPLIRMHDQVLQAANLRNVHVERTGTDGPAVARQTTADLTLLNVTVVNRTVGPGVQATRLTAINSAVAAPQGAAISIAGDSVFGSIKNVTAFGDVGLSVEKKVSTGSNSVLATNSILRGTGFDIGAQGSGLTVGLEYSNWDTTVTAFASLYVGPGNQIEKPLLADPFEADATPLAGSITVDAGTTAGGLFDPSWGGFPRILGAAPDIGAGEYAAPPTVTTGAATDVTANSAVLHADADGVQLPGTVVFEYGTTSAYGSTTPAQNAGPGLTAAIGGLASGTTYVYRAVVTTRAGTVAGAERSFTTVAVPGSGPGPGPGVAPDTTAPVLTKVGLTRKRFRVASAITPLAAARRGTVLRYALSEPAGVRVVVQRKVRRNWRRKALLTRDGVQGSNRLVITGRFPSRRLRPGRHRLVIVATDAAENASAPVRVRFRVKR